MSKMCIERNLVDVIPSLKFIMLLKLKPELKLVISLDTQCMINQR